MINLAFNVTVIHAIEFQLSIISFIGSPIFDIGEIQFDFNFGKIRFNQLAMIGLLSYLKTCLIDDVRIEELVT